MNEEEGEGVRNTELKLQQQHRQQSSIPWHSVAVLLMPGPSRS
jgi:hypothetical protein